MIDIMWIFLADVVCDGDKKDKVQIITIHVLFKLSVTGIVYHNRKVTGNNFHTYTCIFIS